MFTWPHLLNIAKHQHRVNNNFMKADLCLSLISLTGILTSGIILSDKQLMTFCSTILLLYCGFLSWDYYKSCQCNNLIYEIKRISIMIDEKN